MKKKKTKATEAIAAGLEPLAKMMMSFPTNGSLEDMAKKFVKDDLPVDKCIEGAKYIIAEWISDNAYYRKWIRGYLYRSGMISSKIKKNAIDDSKVYEMYYDYNEPADSYRTLAYLKGFTSLKNVIIHKNVPIAHYRYSYSWNNEVYLHTPFFYSDKDSNTAKAIESITFIDTSVIPYYFCKGMSNLKWLTIKGSCYAIEKCAFIDCKNLKQIEITDTISVIGKCAFSENVLSVLSLPQSVRIIKSFEPYIHNGDPYIRKNEDYASFFTKEPDPKIFSMIDYKGEENLVIPEGFTSIAPNTFSCLENLKTVTLPSSMLTIGKFAFSNCRNLSKIILNEGLETISSGAFNKCTSLSTITLPKTLKVIGYGAFNEC